MELVDVVWHFSLEKGWKAGCQIWANVKSVKASKLRLNGTQKNACGTQQLIYFSETWPLSGAFCIKGLQCCRASYIAFAHISRVCFASFAEWSYTPTICVLFLYATFFHPHLSLSLARAQLMHIRTAASQKAAEYIKFLGRCWGYSAEPAHCLKNIFVFLSPACVSVCCYYTSLLDEARLMNTWPLNKRGKAVWFKLRAQQV